MDRDLGVCECGFETPAGIAGPKDAEPRQRDADAMPPARGLSGRSRAPDSP